ncbi:phosphatidylinositol N-acetylglucosaminyltransferase [Terfezia boudieri ATCC MYA-4762]|uniref:Phosphatidylinositol N-acetylglucosaminyltransferase n=1 Tax=Terfezia boudieri ATCC MYA-4762 TaxID=1051890 RepID=A0A3N4LMF8_9PEZI|nr:phosphatidylinositol N-acetylglucosaminyltransferase [Terfezia boudieri ATCC MYA-4762]
MASSNGAHAHGPNGSHAESGTSIPRGGHVGGSNTHSRTGSRGRSTRQKPWRKLLWVKQNYPDNWLQRNVNVHPYDFWPLVAESTVITQHLSSVVIFITCFIAIFTERASPVVVAGGSSVLTVLGYWVWDMGWEVREAVVSKKRSPEAGAPGPIYSAVNTPSHSPTRKGNNNLRQGASKNTSRANSPTRNTKQQSLAYRRRQQRLRRLRTAKSAILIYCTLLGLSPILRSLTESISSDSIWAISSWLFIANCLSFDYGSGVSVKFPASLSTNAAIMASVVLASRLPTTTHVFSLVLFSIEVFGLFPVFRRYLRHISWYGHVTLTVMLVGGAAVGLGMNVGWGWAWGWVGLMGPGIMGGCSWWLMWLQRYKNEIHGPWDPAKPIIRRQWEG